VVLKIAVRSEESGVSSRMVADCKGKKDKDNNP
jgi:hypothetical protein